jgi:hypothetical protein
MTKTDSTRARRRTAPSRMQPTLSDVKAALVHLGYGSIPFLPGPNKGAVGILCEHLAGVPHGPRHLDCTDGEVKTFPLKVARAGALVPKETIAVTMLNKSHLREQDTFESSDCGTKLKRMLYIPYLREQDTIRFFPAIDLTLSPELTATLAKDYEAIRAGFLADGTLTSSTGVYLQNRTKGQGGAAPRTRAYYLRIQFINTFLTRTW